MSAMSISNTQCRAILGSRESFSMIGIGLVCLVFFGWNTAIHADGYYISSASYERLPTLPQQRALIVFKEGMETLVIESSMEADEGDRFTWVLPLPAPPESIEPADTGILSTLSFLTRPHIVESGEVWIGGSIFLLLVCSLISSALMTQNTKRRGCLIYLIVLVISMGFMMSISVGGLPNGQSLDRDMAQVLRHERVGDYEVAVLKGGTFGEIENWLDRHQFQPIEDKAREIVEDYIEEGWVFMLAQLDRKQKGRLTPHPLQITFPSEQPIYPMRLTALGGGETLVRLFIKADRPYVHPSLHLQFTDELDDREEDARYRSVSMRHYRRGAHTYDALAKLIDGEGWLTCLRAQLTPDQMNEDFLLTPLDSTRPHCDRFYSRGSAKAEAFSKMLGILAIGILFVGVFLRKNRRWRALALGIVIGGGSLSCPMSYYSLPIKENIQTYHNSFVDSRRHRAQMEALMKDIPAEAFASTDSLKLTVEARLDAELRNYYTGEPIRIEQSPGNIGIVSRQDHHRVILYDGSLGGNYLATDPRNQ